MENKETKIIAAWCGTGKTYICENTNVSCLEIEYWKYKDGGKQKEYLSDIKESFGKVNYIFISTDPEGLELLNNEKYKIILVYPKLELRNEYLDRYINRNSPPDFIGAFMKYWVPWIIELEKQFYCKQIVLKSGQYLQDVLEFLDES